MPDGAPSRGVLLTVEYDGTGYHGWQEQPGLRTVQGTLRCAIREGTGEERDVRGASRTDRGVHASGQAAAFDSASPIPVDRLPRVLNGRLPGDVRVAAAREVPVGFQPRREAVGKLYRYSALVADRETPFLGRFASRVPAWPDVAAMRQAAGVLEGEHDFRSFQGVTRDPPPSSVRTIFRLDVVEEPPLLHILVAGNAFLYNMVRNIAGTLLEVGRGVRPASGMADVLAARDRRAAGENAEARGLTLWTVAFERSDLDEALAAGRATRLLDGWLAGRPPGAGRDDAGRGESGGR